MVLPHDDIIFPRGNESDLQHQHQQNRSEPSNDTAADLFQQHLQQQFQQHQGESCIVCGLRDTPRLLEMTRFVMRSRIVVNRDESFMWVQLLLPTIALSHELTFWLLLHPCFCPFCLQYLKKRNIRGPTLNGFE